MPGKNYIVDLTGEEGKQLNLHFSLTAEIAKTAEKTIIIFFLDKINRIIP